LSACEVAVEEVDGLPAVVVAVKDDRPGGLVGRLAQFEHGGRAVAQDPPDGQRRADPRKYAVQLVCAPRA
jgi:hypothetical protein